MRTSGVLQDPREGIKHTLLFAVDANRGHVCHWVFPGNVDRNKFIVFLVAVLFPALAQQSGDGVQRFVMYDNLSAHTGPDVEQLFADAGHVPMLRPVHSPDFGPVECCFSHLEMFLKAISGYVKPEDLMPWVSCWASTVTPEVGAGFYAHCGYRIAGMEYKPYV